jgi:REP element-mobilizing transposase RayT
VTARGVAGHALFRDDADRTRFLDLLARTVAEHDWACHAYCLMTSHYHVLIYTPDANLASGMKWLNGAYGQRFNRRHGMRGHVFESRYHSVLIERESHVLELARYISLNPVRAGICSAPERWRWSSYRAWLGVTPCPPFLTVGWMLAHFGSDPKRARARLREFVLEGSRGQRLDTISLQGSDPGLN